MNKRKRKKSKRKAKTPVGVHSRAYEAALSTRQHRPVWNADGSQDAAADGALERIRNWGRYLDENHDLASGVLDDAVKNIVGRGIAVIPRPRRVDGSIDEEFAAEIMVWHQRWRRRVDVTGELDDAEAQRLACRGWLRDGEQFVQHVSGRDANYTFSQADVPYAVEMLESEFCPVDFSEDDWRQGIRHNPWRRPIEYAFHREHPGDYYFAGVSPRIDASDLRRRPASLISHLKFAKRWPATRGISLFAPVVQRLYDCKDWEESERIKNRLLSKWCAAIEKSPDIAGEDDGETDSSGMRWQQMASGTIIDTLNPGESIRGVGPDYPVAGHAEYIGDQIRRIASGTGTKYSTISNHFEGSYSAMRQEMVEREGHYQIREDRFVRVIVQPMYERWLIAAIGDGKIQLPRNVPLGNAMMAEYRGPATPWIDPLREVQADALAVEKGFAHIDQIRIKRGAPAEMIGMPAPTMPEARSPTQLSLITDEDEAA